MIQPSISIRIRKVHRYLGLFLGIQFLLWTISGLYFSWTDLDRIHGDHLKRTTPLQHSFSDLIGVSELDGIDKITTLEVLDIAEQPYYWINKEVLYHAQSGEKKEKVTEKEAIEVAKRFMLPQFKVKSIVKLDSVDAHHEYRGRPLPAYQITYKTLENIKAYVTVNNGKFQTVRHMDWRWFDFLWMTHTMDYQGRDNFNTMVLRIFSLLGLITVLSGFLLWYVSSPRIRKFCNRIKEKRK